VFDAGCLRTRLRVLGRCRPPRFWVVEVAGAGFASRRRRKHSEDRRQNEHPDPWSRRSPSARRRPRRRRTRRADEDDVYAGQYPALHLGADIPVKPAGGGRPESCPPPAPGAAAAPASPSPSRPLALRSPPRGPGIGLAPELPGQQPGLDQDPAREVAGRGGCAIHAGSFLRPGHELGDAGPHGRGVGVHREVRAVGDLGELDAAVGLERTADRRRRRTAAELPGRRHRGTRPLALSIPLAGSPDSVRMARARAAVAAARIRSATRRAIRRTGPRTHLASSPHSRARASAAPP
jgi:hypothetical protein